MRIAVVHKSDGSDVRYSKLCRSMAALGHEMHFIGWDRFSDSKKTIVEGYCKRHIIALPAASGSAGRLRVRSFIKYGQHVRNTINHLEPDIVHAANEEVTFEVLRGRYKKRPKIICDIRDALADRASNKSWPMRMVLQWIARKARDGADQLIATDENRWNRLGKYAEKAIVIHNYPQDPGADLWEKIPSGPLRIFVGGALGKNRGLQTLISAIDGMSDISIESAGWVYDEAAKEFIAHPKVNFHGIITGQQALELAASCDAILCQYAPVTTNNINASPNKVYDAISVGRYILVNREVSMLPWIEKHRTGLICPYGDVEALRNQLEILREWRSSAKEEARRLRDLFEEGYSWDVCARKIQECYLRLVKQ